MDDLRSHIHRATKCNKFTRNDPIKKGTPEATYDPKRLDKLPVRIRPSERQDGQFIYQSWLKSYQSKNLDQPKKTFYQLHKDVVKRLLNDAITLVACDQNQSSEVYAWLCAQRTDRFLIVHYAYTKASFRRFGLQKALLGGFQYAKGEPVLISHNGPVVHDLKQRDHTLMYVPHLQHEGGVKRVEEVYGNHRNAAQ